jgi:hypothetical protein
VLRSGLEFLTEAALIDLVRTLYSRRLIDMTETVTAWDTNEYEVTWSRW